MSQENIQCFRVLMTLRSFFCGEGVGADELDLDDLDLGTFGDLEGGRAAAGGLVDVQHVLHLGAGIARLLVHLLDVLGVGEQLALVQGSPTLEVIFLQQLGVAELLVALELDFRQARLALDHVGEDHALRRDRRPTWML